MNPSPTRESAPSESEIIHDWRSWNSVSYTHLDVYKRQAHGGPVLGLAEMLTPASATLKCLQPFKFILIDVDDYQRLSGLIGSD